MLSKEAFLEQSEQLFFDHILTVSARQALFIQAFRTNHPHVLRRIVFEGAVADFWPHCVDTLLCFKHNPPNNPNPMIRLFDVLTIGEQAKPTIDHLKATLPALCTQVQQATPHTSQTTTPIPTIYLSYALKDKAFALQLQKHLKQQGHLSFLSSTTNRGSDSWLIDTANALNNALLVVAVMGQQAADNHWLQLELLAAHERQKPILPLQLGHHPLPTIPITMLDAIQWDKAQTTLILPQILTHLPAQLPELAPAWQVEDPALQQRLAELFYMDYLKLAELNHILEYTQLEGETHHYQTQKGKLILNPVQARHHFIHEPLRHQEEIQLAPSHHFEDAVTELKQIRRAMLLGDPGSGKTTTLYKVAADLIETALHDPTAPFPLMIRLGGWDTPAEPLVHFLAQSLDQLVPAKAHFHYVRQPTAQLRATLFQQLTNNRVALLLDGLNEIPASQHEAKYAQLNDFLAQYPEVMAFVSCREQDYPPKRRLNLDTVTVAPLDAVRVHEFVHNYLDKEGNTHAGDALFWQLVSGRAYHTYQSFMEEIGAKLSNPFQTFWLDDTLPHNLQFGYKNGAWRRWLKARAHPANLLQLAYNPFMLYMLVKVYQAYDETLPANRGQLFAMFVETLLAREELLKREGQQAIPTPAGKALLQNLTTLAYAMQSERRGGDILTLTTFPLATINRYLNQQQQYYATSANLLTLSEEGRFSHQLLQEYFLARAMIERIWGADKLQASAIWPADSWWQPTNWEEATILLAGLYSDDCTKVLNWLADANPELTARCIVESGANTPDSTKLDLRDRWLPRLTDLQKEPNPQARAAIGRALGLVMLETEELLDNRRGVGFIIKNRQKIPDIVWSETIPAGNYTLSEDTNAWLSLKKRRVDIQTPYQLAIYPVTMAQFQCFIDGDFRNPRWWRGMPPAEDDGFGTTYQLHELSEQAFKYHNHPRERVSWYQAVAFCRWLSHLLGYEVRLPYEDEWEVAARYPDNRFYPWGNQFDAKKANTGEGDNIGQTTAVGLYPNGRHPQLGLYDLSGNVWEWCQNKVDDPADDGVDASGARRVVRGGSWALDHDFARAAFRHPLPPYDRDLDYGFRLVQVAPS